MSWFCAEKFSGALLPIARPVMHRDCHTGSWRHQLGDVPYCSCHICFEDLPLVTQLDPRQTEAFAFGNCRLHASVGKEPKKKEESSWGGTDWVCFTPSPIKSGSSHHQDWPTVSLLRTRSRSSRVCKLTQRPDSAWMKQQRKVFAAGCSFERGRGNTSPRLLLICFGLQVFFLSYWGPPVLPEKQDHAWCHPSVIIS